MSNVIVKILVDDSDMEKKYTLWDKQLNDLGSRWAQMKETIKREASNIGYTIIGVINIVRTVANMLNLTIDPVLEATLSMIATVTTSMIALGTALEATGVLAPLGVVITAAMVGVSVVAGLAAIKNANEAKESMKDVESILGNLSTMILRFS